MTRKQRTRRKLRRAGKPVTVTARPHATIKRKRRCLYPDQCNRPDCGCPVIR